MTATVTATHSPEPVAEPAQRRPLLLVGGVRIDRHGDLDAAVPGDGLDDVRLYAIARGYTAQLAAASGQHTAALNHLHAATGLTSDPTLTSWLAATEATVCAAAGNPDAGADALDRAGKALANVSGPPAVRWFFDHDPARLAAAAGRVLLHAKDWTAARDQLTAAADQLDHQGVTARRALVLCLLDLAITEAHASSANDAARTAIRAVEPLRRLSFAAGTAALHVVRGFLAEHRPDGTALRALDAQIAELPRPG